MIHIEVLLHPCESFHCCGEHTHVTRGIVEDISKLVDLFHYIENVRVVGVGGGVGGDGVWLVRRFCKSWVCMCKMV